MKAVIFAGGVGTRLWPLSRKKSPKQFEKIVGNQSTLQLAVSRLTPEFDTQDIYISTGNEYVETVIKQLPMIAAANVIAEPEKKDVGPAVALAMGMLAQKSPDAPVVILWSDHLIKKQKLFKSILEAAGELVLKNKEKIIFIGQKPRFASENLGWIEFGQKITTQGEINFNEFKGFKYRPTPAVATEYFESDHFAWNLGYFVSTPGFIYQQFKQFTPEIYKRVEKIIHSKPENFEQVLKEEYALMPEVNFDHAIIEQIDPAQAYVVCADIGWSDVGAWEALKDALQENIHDNITLGNVLLKECRDNLVYNYESEKTVVGIDLEECIIINTGDVLLVTKKTSATKVKKLVQELEEDHQDHLI